MVLFSFLRVHWQDRDAAYCWKTSAKGNLHDEDELHLLLQRWRESDSEVRIQQGGQAKQLRVREQTNIVRSVCSPGNNQPHDSLGSCWNKPPWNCGSIFHLPVTRAKRRVSSLMSPLRLCLSWPGPPQHLLRRTLQVRGRYSAATKLEATKRFISLANSDPFSKKKKKNTHSACQEIKNSLYHKQKQIFVVICKETAAFGGAIHYSALNKQRFLHNLCLPAP